ncbi:MAG: type II toxin-antitoxin system VapC family toxin [Erythrobacter sp.]|nr:type II toxin-antitoxin system VapC family toxin [Erythrobacter sp.]
MNIALDASVAIKLYVLEDMHDAARRLVAEADTVFAPDFLLAEVCNIAWKKVRRNEIDTVQAREFPAALRRRLTLYPTVAFVERALGIALTLDHPVYDCLYIACAEANDGVVVTADRRLCRAVQQTAFAGLVRHLEDATP